MLTITMKTPSRLAPAVAFVLAVTACGGKSGSGAACKTVDACGGNVAGHWTVADSCVTDDVDITSSCAGGTAKVAITFQGGVTYSADGTYVQTGTQAGKVHYQLPTACFGGQTCTTIAGALKTGSMEVSMGFSYSSVTCTNASGNSCACDATIATSDAGENGTYTTSGGTLTTTHDGTSDTTKYCVEGNVMYQMPPDTSAAGAIVLDKQP